MEDNEQDEENSRETNGSVDGSTYEDANEEEQGGMKGSGRDKLW